LWKYVFVVCCLVKSSLQKTKRVKYGEK
jgi:hypothetical protein